MTAGHRHSLLLVSLLALAVLVMAKIWWHLETQHYHAYDPYIGEAAARYKVEQALIRAVIWRESNFNPKAMGKAKERGLMQVTPGAGQEWAESENIDNFRPTDLFHPRTNILAGTWYLSRALQRWKEADQPFPFALAEYNAGPAHARRWANGLDPLNSEPFLQAMDFPTTKKYILSILERYEKYRQDHDPTFGEALKRKAAAFWSNLQD
jgi:soluble lytic murein transglycosylase